MSFLITFISIYVYTIFFAKFYFVTRVSMFWGIDKKKILVYYVRTLVYYIMTNSSVFTLVNHSILAFREVSVMMKAFQPIFADDIAQMIDISAVRINSTDDEILKMVEAAHTYHCYLVTVLPSQTKLIKHILNQISNPPKLGGNVGFPSGGETTPIKVAAAKELLQIGVDEIDMVINVAALLSGRYNDVFNDIAGVVKTAAEIPVKVILECHYLNDDQIRIGCDLAIKAGAGFIKTGTGWAPSGATLENVSLIKDHVGDAIKIKASGGIREVKTLLRMYQSGASRFGISAASAVNILEELNLLTQPIFLDNLIREIS